MGLAFDRGVAAQFPLTLTTDGVEQTFQSNYLGHFALVTRLLPLLERSSQRRGAPSRVVHPHLCLEPPLDEERLAIPTGIGSYLL